MLRTKSTFWVSTSLVMVLPIFVVLLASKEHDSVATLAAVAQDRDLDIKIRLSRFLDVFYNFSDDWRPHFVVSNRLAEAIQRGEVDEAVLFTMSQKEFGLARNGKAMSNRDRRILLTFLSRNMNLIDYPEKINDATLWIVVFTGNKRVVFQIHDTGWLIVREHPNDFLLLGCGDSHTAAQLKARFDFVSLNE